MINLETWLRKNNMSTKSFASLVPCSRQVIWKVKRDIPIDTEIAMRIQKITKSEVSPDCHPKGKHRV